MDREELLLEEEQQNRKKGITVSVILHILLIILALLPLLTFPDPPPGEAGILVNLGLPDVGEGTDNAGPSTPSEPEVVPEDPEPQPEVEETPPPPPTPEVVEQPTPKTPDVVTTEDPSAVALRKKKEEEARKKAEADAKARAEAEAERKRREEEARKKAEAEAARKAAADAARKKQEEADKFKDQIGGLFGDGDGKGKTGKPGNQGDPNGDPNAKKLEGISTGSGTVGGGLGDRGVLSAPKITDNSQKQGTVVVRVCVNKTGAVISSEFTQRGSTTSDNRLKELAVSNAKKWKFSSGGVDKQCGTITYRFRVQ